MGGHRYGNGCTGVVGWFICGVLVVIKFVGGVAVYSRGWCCGGFMRGGGWG